jgi:hypothetical protein
MPPSTGDGPPWTGARSPQEQRAAVGIRMKRARQFWRGTIRPGPRWWASPSAWPELLYGARTDLIRGHGGGHRHRHGRIPPRMNAIDLNLPILAASWPGRARLSAIPWTSAETRASLPIIHFVSSCPGCPIAAGRHAAFMILRDTAYESQPQATIDHSALLGRRTP